MLLFVLGLGLGLKKSLGLGLLVELPNTGESMGFFIVRNFEFEIIYLYF